MCIAVQSIKVIERDDVLTYGLYSTPLISINSSCKFPQASGEHHG